MTTAKKDKKINLERRHSKVRAKIKGTSERPRLSVNRSNMAMRVQLIDDVKGHTVVAVDLFRKGKKTPLEIAKEAGLEIAKKAKKVGVEKVVFDRGGHPFHGRVKMVAEGAREGGLQF